MVIKMYGSRAIYRILIVCLMVLFMIAGMYIGTRYIAKTEANPDVQDVVNKDNVKVYSEEESKEEEEEESDAELTVTYVDIYSECGHRKERQALHVRGNKEKIEESEDKSGSGYELMAEEDGILVFERVVEASCTDHYKLAIVGDKVCVYKINEKGKYELYQTLEVELDTIREDLVEQLKNGVVLDSLEELFVFLEDIES